MMTALSSIHSLAQWLELSLIQEWEQTPHGLTTCDLASGLMLLTVIGCMCRYGNADAGILLHRWPVWRKIVRRVGAGGKMLWVTHKVPHSAFSSWALTFHLCLSVLTQTIKIRMNIFYGATEPRSVALFTLADGCFGTRLLICLNCFA